MTTGQASRTLDVKVLPQAFPVGGHFGTEVKIDSNTTVGQD
jgi:hypothetical protein